MFELDHPKKSPLFSYHSPLGTKVLGLVSIPHSGEDIPPVFESFLSGDLEAYREDIDFRVNELVDIPELQKAGIGVLVSHVHRICVDLNRDESNCVLFWKKNTKEKTLVKLDPDVETVRSFVETFHRPYYEIMRSFLTDLRRKNPAHANFIDLHSMPSTASAYHMKMNPNQKQRRPDFCLSDFRGKTCIPEFIGEFQKKFQSAGFDASINDPYVGGNVTQWADALATNNIQIEINRALYMDEVTKELLPEKARNLKSVITETLISGLKTFGP